MKTRLKFPTKIGLAAALGLTSSLSAIERPDEKDDGVLPPDALPKFSEENVNPALVPKAKSLKVTWLGVRSEAVSDDLAWNLKLDSGVIARVVDPTSPAAQAGLRDRDIILKVDGLAVASRDQLRTAVTARQPGEEIILNVLRQGEALELKVVLGEREVLPQFPRARFLDEQFPGFAQVIPPGMNDDEVALLQKKLLERVEEALKVIPSGGSGLNDLLNQNLTEPQDFNLGIQNTGSFSFSDGKGRVGMTTRNGKSHVTVTDHEGNVVFDGPYTTEEEKNAVPDDLRKRIEMLGIDGGAMNGFRLKFNLGEESQLQSNDE